MLYAGWEVSYTFPSSFDLVADVAQKCFFKTLFFDLNFRSCLIYFLYLWVRDAFFHLDLVERAHFLYTAFCFALYIG